MSNKDFASGECIFQEGESAQEMYLIESGRVCLVKRVDQKDIELARIGRGSLVGEASFLEQQPRKFTAIASEDTTLFIIDRFAFQEQISQCPEWLTKTILALFDQLREAKRRNETHLLSSEEAKIINMLLLNTKYGTQTKNGLALNLKVIINIISFELGIPVDRLRQFFIILRDHALLEFNRDRKGHSILLIPDLANLERFLAYQRFASEYQNEKDDKLEQILDDSNAMQLLRLIAWLAKQNGEQANAHQVLDYTDLAEQVREMIGADISNSCDAFDLLAENGLVVKERVPATGVVQVTVERSKLDQVKNYIEMRKRYSDIRLPAR